MDTKSKLVRSHSKKQSVIRYPILFYLFLALGTSLHRKKFKQTNFIPYILAGAKYMILSKRMLCRRNDVLIYSEFVKYIQALKFSLLMKRSNISATDFIQNVLTTNKKQSDAGRFIIGQRMKVYLDIYHVLRHRYFDSTNTCSFISIQYISIYCDISSVTTIEVYPIAQ